MPIAANDVLLENGGYDDEGFGGFHENVPRESSETEIFDVSFIGLNCDRLLARIREFIVDRTIHESWEHVTVRAVLKYSVEIDPMYELRISLRMSSVT